MNPYDRMLGRIHAMTDAIERRSPRKERPKKKREAVEPADHQAKRARKKPRRAAKHRKARHR